MPERPTLYTISPSDDSTLCLELSTTGLRRRKRSALHFDKFGGEMSFAEEDPGAFQLTLNVDTASSVCKDAWLAKKKRKAMAANVQPEIRFTANSLSPKLRGFSVEGVLQMCGATRPFRMNLVFGARRNGWIQLDGDATFRLSDFSLPRPSALFGLIGTKDEVAVRLLLWAIPRSDLTEPVKAYV